MEYLKTLEIVSNILVSITMVTFWLDVTPDLRVFRIIRR